MPGVNLTNTTINAHLFPRLIASNPTSFSMTGCNISDTDAMTLAENFSKLFSTGIVVELTTLNLSNNNIGSEGAMALAKALQNAPSLQTFNLSNNQIDFESAQEIFTILYGQKQTPLSVVDLSGDTFSTLQNKEFRRRLKNKIFSFLLESTNGTSSAVTPFWAKAPQPLTNFQPLAAAHSLVDNVDTELHSMFSPIPSLSL